LRRRLVGLSNRRFGGGWRKELKEVWEAGCRKLGLDLYYIVPILTTFRSFSTSFQQCHYLSLVLTSGCERYLLLPEPQPSVSCHVWWSSICVVYCMLHVSLSCVCAPSRATVYQYSCLVMQDPCTSRSYCSTQCRVAVQ